MSLSAKFLPGLLLALSSLTGSLFLIKQPGEAQGVNGRFINNVLSGKCIDVAGAPGRGNGAPLQLWDCELTGANPDNNSTTDQRWVLTNGGFMRRLPLKPVANFSKSQYRAKRLIEGVSA